MASIHQEQVDIQQLEKETFTTENPKVLQYLESVEKDTTAIGQEFVKMAEEGNKVASNEVPGIIAPTHSEPVTNVPDASEDDPEEQLPVGQGMKVGATDLDNIEHDNIVTVENEEGADKPMASQAENATVIDQSAEQAASLIVESTSSHAAKAAIEKQEEVTPAELLAKVPEPASRQDEKEPELDNITLFGLITGAIRKSEKRILDRLQGFERLVAMTNYDVGMIRTKNIDFKNDINALSQQVTNLAHDVKKLQAPPSPSFPLQFGPRLPITDELGGPPDLTGDTKPPRQPQSTGSKRGCASRAGSVVSKADEEVTTALLLAVKTKSTAHINAAQKLSREANWKPGQFERLFEKYSEKLSSRPRGKRE